MLGLTGTCIKDRMGRTMSSRSSPPRGRLRVSVVTLWTSTTYAYLPSPSHSASNHDSHNMNPPQYLISNEGLSSSQYLTTAQAGTEATSGTAVLTTYEFIPSSYSPTHPKNYVLMSSASISRTSFSLAINSGSSSGGATPSTSSTTTATTSSSASGATQSKVHTTLLCLLDFR